MSGHWKMWKIFTLNLWASILKVRTLWIDAVRLRWKFTFRRPSPDAIAAAIRDLAPPFGGHARTMPNIWRMATCTEMNVGQLDDPREGANRPIGLSDRVTG
jgi:hypothetical protein